MFGYQAEKNTDYNKYLEKAITPYIEDRIKKDVVDSIVNAIKAQKWKAGFLDSLDIDNLMQSIILNSTLGKNLGELTDSPEVAKIIVFKHINIAIKDSNVANYTPIQDFSTKYPELLQRIESDHPDYFANHTVAKVGERSANNQNIYQSFYEPNENHQKSMSGQTSKFEEHIDHE